MREILDREMPERRKRRGVIWWWPLGVAAGLALWLWLGSDPGQHAPSVHPQDSMAAQADPTPAPSMGDPGPSSMDGIKNNNLNAEAGSDLNPGIEDASGGDRSIATSGSSSRRTRNLNGNSYKTNPVSRQGALDITDSTPGSFDPSLSDGVEGNASIDAALPGQANPSVAPGDATTNSGLREMLAVVDPLETKIDALARPEPNIAMDVAAELPRRRTVYPGGISLFASAGVQAGIPQGLGRQAGLGGGWQVLPHLSLRTSVERHWTDLDASLPGSAQDREFANADSPIISDPLGQGNVVIPEGNLSNASSASDLTDLVSTVRHWRWNVGAQYRITPWLAAELGGGLDWGIQAQTRYPIIPGTGTSQDHSEGTSLLNDYGFVRSSSAIAFGGVAWTPVRWLEVYGRYTHAFSPYLDVTGAGIATEKTSRTDKLGSIQLGVRAVIRP